MPLFFLLLAARLDPLLQGHELVLLLVLELGLALEHLLLLAVLPLFELPHFQRITFQLDLVGLGVVLLAREVFLNTS